MIQVAVAFVLSSCFGLLIAKIGHYVIEEVQKENDPTLPPCVHSIWHIFSLVKWIKLFKKDTMSALTIARNMRGNTFRINLIFKDLFITYEPSLVKKYVSKEWERMLDFYQPTTKVHSYIVSF